MNSDTIGDLNTGVFIKADTMKIQDETTYERVVSFSESDSGEVRFQELLDIDGNRRTDYKSEGSFDLNQPEGILLKG